MVRNVTLIARSCGRASLHCPFVVGYALPVATGSPAARHSGRPSCNRRTLKPRARNCAIAS